MLLNPATILQASVTAQLSDKRKRLAAAEQYNLPDIRERLQGEIAELELVVRVTPKCWGRPLA